MFTFRVFVDDKRLADSLKALRGIAHHLDAPQEVVNATKGPNGKLRQETGGSLIDMVINTVLKSGKDKVTMEELRHWTTAAGGNKESIYYVTTTLKERRVLSKMPGQRGVYRVLKPK